MKAHRMAKPKDFKFLKKIILIKKVDYSWTSYGIFHDNCSNNVFYKHYKLRTNISINIFFLNREERRKKETFWDYPLDLNDDFGRNV